MSLNNIKNIAVVGSSASLLENEYGELIDSFTDVARFNRAPVEGFENHVGRKTTIRISNNHVFANLPFGNDRWSDKFQPTNFIKNTKNCKIILIGDKIDGSLTVWSNRNKHIDESCDPYYIDRTFAKVGNGKHPSVGFTFVYFLINNGVKPHLFGFDLGDEKLSHYWEERDKKSHCHDFNQERVIINKWVTEGKLIVN